MMGRVEPSVVLISVLQQVAFLNWDELRRMVGAIHSLALQMKKLRQKWSSDWPKPTQKRGRQTSDHHFGLLVVCNL